MTFDPATINNLLLGLSAWGAAFIAALWLSLVIWTYRDIRNRGQDPLARILAVLVVAVLFLPGIIIYLILRPSRTLDEEYQQTLEEEALLRTIEETNICPGCSRHTKENWLLCPHCNTKLKKPCHHCSSLMELSWNICPHCGTTTPGYKREAMTLDEALQPLSLGQTFSPETPEKPDPQASLFPDMSEEEPEQLLFPPVDSDTDEDPLIFEE